MVKANLNPSFRFAIYSIPATILLIWTGLTDPINLPKLLAVSALSFTSTIIFFSTGQLREKDIQSKAEWGIVALYTSIAVSMFFSGILGSENWVRIVFGSPGRNNGVLYYLSIIAICLMLIRTAISRIHFDFVYKIISITAFIFTLYSLLQFLNLDPIQWTNPYNRIIGTLGNPNFSAAALAIFAIYFVYLLTFMPSRKRGLRISYFFVSVATGLLSAATGSIQGIVVIGVGVLIIVYMKLRERVTTSYFPITSLLIASISLLALFASFLGFGPLGNSLEQYTLKLRGYYAYFGFKGMIDSPIHGVGVDSYNQAFRLFRTEDFIQQYSVGLNADNAHSTPAQIGATFGIAVFVLYMVLQVLVLIKSLQIINRAGSDSLQLRGIALLWILVFSQSLLSIEIIGLGVLNWVFGAIILSASRQDVESRPADQIKGKQSASVKRLPEWTGALATFTLLVSMIPIGLIAREDSAYKNIFALQIQNPDDKNWVREQYTKLSSYTLLEPSKVSRILENMFNSEMFSEIETAIKNLYKANPDEVAANELLATYYRNAGDSKNEMKVREDLRALDPNNYVLELQLAKVYASQNMIDNLRDSVNRIKTIAPESPELNEAKTLLSTLENR